jgi:hypothetical protein
MRRLGLSLLGGILGLGVWFAFCLGSGLRACLVDQLQIPRLLWGDTLSLFINAYVTFIPFIIIIAGLMAGFGLRLKPLLISASVLAALAFGIAYAITSGTCAGVGI